MPGLIREFNVRMALSGYSKRFRRKVADCAVRKYEKMINTEKEGGRGAHRNREERTESRKENQGKRSKAGWFRARKFNAVLRIENTPQGELKRESILTQS